MKNKFKFLTVFLLLKIGIIYSQVGIGITTPDASAVLDVSSTTKGVLVPRHTTISRNAIVSPANGLVIFNTSTNQLEINTGTSSSPIWSAISTTSFAYGDIKTGIQTTDHNGWVKLDGRAISTLTPSQQANATALGIGANLPNANNAFLVQNGTALGTVSGSSTKTIAQNQLPNVTLTGTTNTTGSHTHTVQVQYYSQPAPHGSHPNATTTWEYEVTQTKTTSAAGDHSHTVTTSSLNGGVTQQAIDVTPKSLSINTFIYLGN